MKVMAQSPDSNEILRGAPTLADRRCVACHGGMATLGGDEIADFSKYIEGWEVVNSHHLLKKFKFLNFQQALEFVNRVGELAEAECHHPDILLRWGSTEITLWTRAASGLTVNDFILAAKIDRLQS
jgi:4a-hydroxytetrahydrobiopterin dehydratase